MQKNLCNLTLSRTCWFQPTFGCKSAGTLLGSKSLLLGYVPPLLQPSVNSSQSPNQQRIYLLEPNKIKLLLTLVYSVRIGVVVKKNRRSKLLAFFLVLGEFVLGCNITIWRNISSSHFCVLGQNLASEGHFFPWRSFFFITLKGTYLTCK